MFQILSSHFVADFDADACICKSTVSDSQGKDDPNPVYAPVLSPGQEGAERVGRR